MRRMVNHEANVLQVDRLSPSFVRVELGGPGLRDWTTLDVPDEGCIFRFPGDEHHRAPNAERGRWYTVRRIDPGQGRLTVDFITHPGGPGGEWAATAKPGDQLRIYVQDSWYKRPEEIRWQWLLGDVAGLPAFARIIEETAGAIPTRAVIETAETGDRQQLDGADVTWLHSPDIAAGVSGLIAAVRELPLPEGPGYVYVAGEAAVTRDVKAYLRHELQLPAESYDAIGYWRAGAA